MFKLASLALVAVAAVSAVNGIPLTARNSPPAGWITEIMEPYADYHTRYLAIGCKEKHNTDFFHDCCHPMKKGETLEKNRKAYCRPGANLPSTTTPPKTLVSKPTPVTSPDPQPTSVPDDDEDCEDDENGDDNDDDDCEESTTVPPSYQTPHPDPKPTPKKDEPTTTPKDEPTTPTPKHEPTTTTTTNDPSPTPHNTPSTETHSGGFVTFFSQNGVAGACGTVHSDNDFVAALDSRTYGNTGAKSSYCGKKIRITWQGKSVDVTVADACPTCENSNSVDLSIAAFEQLAPQSVGLLKDITWELLG